MKITTKIFSVLAALLMGLFANGVAAQNTTIQRDTVNNEIVTITETRTDAEEDIKFFFQLDKFNFVEDFSTNAEQLARLDEIMADENALVGVDSLVLVAAASIDGLERKNDILAKNRAQTIKELLQERYSKIVPELLRTQSTAEDWAGLRAMIVADDNVPYKAEALKVIDSDRAADSKEWLLKTMRGGAVWRYLRENILPKTRYGASVVFFYNINREKMIEELVRPKEIRYVRDTIVQRDTLRVVDTIRVDMRTRKFKKSYEVETLEN